MKTETKKSPVPARLCHMLAGLCLIIALAGCSEDTPWGATSTYPMVATPDPVAVRLADAADKAASSLQSLAAVEQVRTPSPLPPITPSSSDDLEKTMSVAWTGPASPLLERLASRVGYRFQQIGTPPATPVTVTIDVIEQPILDILRDAGLQMGSRADLVIDSNRHVIELQYAPNP